MSSTPSDSVPDLSPSVSWLPGLLLVGALASLLAGALGASSSIVELVQGEQQGFTLASALAWATALAQVGVLIAYLGLAHHADSDALRRSSVGAFGAYWLMQIASLGDDTVLPQTPILILCAAALIALIIYTCWRLLKGLGGGVGTPGLA
jgi:hypothetical protein